MKNLIKDTTEESIEETKEKETITIDGEEYEVIKVIPGKGFKSKKEEEKFIDELINSYEEECKYNIYNTPYAGLRA